MCSFVNIPHGYSILKGKLFKDSGFSSQEKTLSSSSALFLWKKTLLFVYKIASWDLYKTDKKYIPSNTSCIRLLPLELEEFFYLNIVEVVILKKVVKIESFSYCNSYISLFQPNLPRHKIFFIFLRNYYNWKGSKKNLHFKKHILEDYKMRKQTNLKIWISPFS